MVKMHIEKALEFCALTGHELHFFVCENESFGMIIVCESAEMREVFVTIEGKTYHCIESTGLIGPQGLMRMPELTRI